VKWLQRAPWWAWAGLALLALVVAGGLVARSVVREYAPVLARERVESELAAVLGRPVRVERVVLRPWLARAELHGLTVAGGPDWADGTALTAGRVEVGVGVASLWRRELVISRVLLEDVGVTYETAADGDGVPLPDVIPSRFPLGPVTVEVRSVEVSRGHLVFRRPDGTTAIALRAVDVRATPAEGGVAASGSAGAVVLGFADVEETVHAVRASLRLQRDRLVVSRLEGRWRAERASVTGEVSDLAASPRLALRADGVLPLAWLGDRLGAPWPVAGSATVDARIAGTVSAPEISARARVPQLRAGPISARRVTGVVTWSAQTLRVTDVVADALGGRVAGALTWPTMRPDESAVDVRLARVSLAGIESLAGTSLGVAGEVTAAGQLRGDLSRPLALRGRFTVAEASVRLPGELEKLGAGAVSGEIAIADAGAEIVRLEARWPLVRIEDIQGRVHAEGPDGLRAVATGDAGSLARLFGAPWLEGDATLGVEVDGRWTALELAGRARSAALRVADARLAGVDVAFAASGRTLRIARATATLGSTTAEATGVLRLPAGEPLGAPALRERLEIDGEVRTGAGRVEDFAAWIPAEWRATGPFALGARLEGQSGAWRARGTVTGGPLTVRGERVEGLDARFDARPDRLEVARLTGRVREVPVSGNGTWAWNGTGVVRGEAGPVSLAQLPGLPDGVELAGVAAARGEARARGGRWSGSASIDLREARVAGAVLGRGTATLALRDDVASAEATFPGARVSARASAPLDGSAPAQVHIGFVDFDLEPLLGRAGELPAPVAPVRAVVSGTAALSVPFDAPASARGTVTLDAARLLAAGETWRAPAPIVVRRDPGVTHADRLRLESGAGAIVISGSVTDEGRLALSVDAGIALAPLARLWPEVREARGTLDARLELSGKLPAPRATGRGTIREASFVLRDVPHPVSDVRAELALTPGRVRLETARASILGSTITASGDVLLDAPAPRLEVAVEGDIPLDVIAALRPEIRDARGIVQVRARVGGTTTLPEPTGQATVRAEYLTLRDYAEPLRDVRARLTASPARVSVVDAVATVGGGTVHASGGLTLEAFTPGSYAFTVQARRVSLEPAPDFTTTWDADLELVGLGGRSQLRGEARLLRGAWVSETPLLRLLLERGAAASPTPEEGIGLSIRLVFGDNLLVRTAVARFGVRGTLALEGTTAAPIVFGTADAVNGQIIFRKHRFTIVRGSARFVDPRRIDPVLDVEATTRIGRYDVRLQVTGRSENLEVRLASSPPLPEEDVLSLVAFGVTRAELGRGGAAAVAGEVAGLILRDFLGFGGGPGLGPLEVFELKSTETAGRTLDVGTRIGERATVTYSQGLENTAERRLRLEYEVVGPLVIAGEQDFRGGFGADVLVRLRFR
jgi:hypothetical protein